MILVLQIAAGVALGQGLWLLAARFLKLPKWIQPQITFSCKIDRVGLVDYRIHLGIEGLGK